MCMYTIDPTLRKDQTDIIVYKIILKDISDESSIKYLTPFISTIIKMPYLMAEGEINIRECEDFMCNIIFSVL